MEAKNKEKPVQWEIRPLGFEFGIDNLFIRIRPRIVDAPANADRCVEVVASNRVVARGSGVTVDGAFSDLQKNLSLLHAAEVLWNGVEYDSKVVVVIALVTTAIAAKPTWWEWSER